MVLVMMHSQYSFPNKLSVGNGRAGILGFEGLALHSVNYVSEPAYFSKYTFFCVSEFLSNLMEALFMCFINL